jgi:hypothetical protein
MDRHQGDAKSDQSHSLLVRLMDVLVPPNGAALFLVMNDSYEAYFDESGTHDGSTLLCVAGYLFNSEQCKRFDEEWLAVLEEFSLPYFRMSECIHATGAFKGRREICDLVARRMIGIIKRRVERGMAVSIAEKDFKEHVPEGNHEVTGPAYSWCVRWILSQVQDWVEKFNPEARVSYFFESGHRDQRTTNEILSRMFGSALGRERFYYAAHAFSGKLPTEKSPTVLRPLQAADLLAWQYRTHRMRELAGNRVRRLDFNSLLQCPHVSSDFTAEAIDERMNSMLAEVRQAELAKLKTAP